MASSGPGFQDGWQWLGRVQKNRRPMVPALRNSQCQATWAKCQKSGKK